MRVGWERGLACMPGRKLTALRYESVSAIGDRVTDVTRERNAGTRQRQQGKKCSKNLSRCRSRDIGNGFDREDVFSERTPADIDRGSGEQNGLPRRDLMDVQTRSTGTVNTYPTPRSV